MNDKIIGYVLSCSDYRDNDYLLQVLCKGYGRLTLVSKGAKKINSKSSKVSMPNTMVEFIVNLDKNNTIYTINNANLIKSYLTKNVDLNLNLIVQMMQEIILKTTLDLESSDQVFDLLIRCLDDLNESNYYLILSIFVSEYLKILGINPYVDGCVKCLDQHVYGISVKDGGFICKKCFNQETHQFNVDILRKFRLLNKASIDNYKIIEEKYEFLLADVDILISFLINYGGFQIKSYELFKMVNN